MRAGYSQTPYCVTSIIAGLRYDIGDIISRTSGGRFSERKSEALLQKE